MKTRLFITSTMQRLQPLASIGIICAGAMVALGPMMAAAEDAFVHEEFDDDSITDGDPATWWVSVFNGEATAEVVDGGLALTASQPTEGAWISLPKSSYPHSENASVRAQMRLQGGANRVWLSAQLQANHWVAGALEPGGVLYIENRNPRLDSPRIETDLSVTEEDVVLQLDVVGHEASLFAWRPNEPMPEEPQVTLTLPATIAGSAGGGMNGASLDTSLTFRYITMSSEPIRDVPDEEILFVQDEFMDEDAQDGVPAHWSTEVVNGNADFKVVEQDWVLTATVGSTQAVWTSARNNEKHLLEDTSIRSQMRLEGSASRVWLWAQAASGSWTVGVLEPGGVLYLRHQRPRLDSPHIQTDLRVAEEDVVLQLDIVGDEASLYAWRPGEALPETPQVTLTVPATRVGQTGGGMNNASVDTSLSFRYLWFKSEPIRDGDIITDPSITQIKPGKNMLTLQLRDGDEVSVDPSTIVLKIDEQIVNTTVSKLDDITTVAYAYDPAGNFSPGSEHVYHLQAQASEGEDQFTFQGTFEVPTPLLPPGVRLLGPEGGDGSFGVRYLWGTGGTIDRLEQAVELIQSADDPQFQGRVFDTMDPFFNHGDDPDRGLFGSSRSLFPSNVVDNDAWTDDDFVQLAKGTIRIAKTGTYTFGVHSDDGFALRIIGGEFTSARGNGAIDPASSDSIIHPSVSADTSTRAVIDLEAGIHELEFLWWDRGGAGLGEIYVAKGESLEDADTDAWELVGSGPLSTLVAPIGDDSEELILIASPKTLEDTDADSSFDPAFAPYRAQQVFPASDFASLPSGHRTIDSIAIRRPDKDAEGPYTESWEDIEIKMSHTTAAPENLSLTFDENIQSEVVTVYHGPLTLRTENDSSDDGTKAFDQFVKLQTPFVYDPIKGNLLVETISTSGVATEGPASTDTFTSPITRVYAFDPDATEGAFWGGFPMQFAFVADVESNGKPAAPELKIERDAVLLSYRITEQDYQLESRDQGLLGSWSPEMQPSVVTDGERRIGFTKQEAEGKEFRLTGDLFTPPPPTIKLEQNALLLSYEVHNFEHWRIESHPTLELESGTPWQRVEAVDSGNVRRAFVPVREPVGFFRTSLTTDEHFLDEFSNQESPVPWTIDVWPTGTRERTEEGWEWTPVGKNMSQVIIHSYSNASIHTKFRLLGPGSFSGGGVFIWARSAYAAGIRANGELGIWSNEKGFIVTRATDLDLADKDIHLQLDFVGDKLKLWGWEDGTPKPEEPQISLTDDESNKGIVGLFYNPGGGSAKIAFRSFELTRLNAIE